MKSLHDDYAFLGKNADSILVLKDQSKIEWYTFAGNTLNLALADALRSKGFEDISANDFSIRINGTTDHQRLSSAIEKLTTEFVFSAFRVVTFGRFCCDRFHHLAHLQTVSG